MALLGESYIYESQNLNYRLPINYKTSIIEGNDLDDFHAYIKELPTVFRLITIPYQTPGMAAPSLLVEWQEDGIPLRNMIWHVHKVSENEERLECLGYYFLKFPQDKGRITF